MKRNLLCQKQNCKQSVFRNINRSRLNAKSALKGHIPFSSVMARNVRSALQECMFCCGWIIEGKKNHDSETKTVVHNDKSKDKKVTQNSGSLTSATVTSWITLLNDTEDHVLDMFNGNPYSTFRLRLLFSLRMRRTL